MYLIAAHVAKPMYISYYSTLSHHGLTEQVPWTVRVVTSTRAQSREIHDVPRRVMPVAERKFFDFEPTSAEGMTVQVSELGKTLVDCTDHREFYSDPRELTTAMRTVNEQGCNREIVSECLDRLDNGAATERIVYLVDQFGIDFPTHEKLVASLTSGYSPLDPTPDQPTVRVATGSTSSQPRWSRRNH